MESSTSRQEREEQRQLALRKQIALLQAQLEDPDAPAASPLATVFQSPKRKRTDAKVLAPASPSPKRRRKSPDPLTHPRSLPKATGTLSGKRSLIVPPVEARSSATPRSTSKPPPSNVLNKLSRLGTTAAKAVVPEPVERSTSFAEKPRTAAEPEKNYGAPRDDRLVIVEELEPGPYDHKPPFDDPLFEKLEPNSGIHLTSRCIEHEEFQEYLSGRYYISPSKLYSVIQLLPNNQGYDVPVVGDWVTIGVVAERGPIKVSRAPVAIGQGEERDADDPGDGSSTAKDANSWKAKKKGKDEPPKVSGRKFVNLRLVDFGARSRASANGGKAVIRGDAFLSLLLFEAESYDKVDRDDGNRAEKIYKGGSRGAFESMSKLREGSVVALLNPRVLKPFQRAADTPHPTTNILALTPESAASIVVIGHARDLGMCGVVRRDGKPCGSWCDKRVSDVCDYHVQHAVERRRAGRAEFSTGTSGLTTGPPKRKSDYDPVRKWGLAPETKTPTLTSDAGGATYVVSGHVVSAKAPLFTGEKIGREAQARAQRASERDTDKMLKQLLERDKEGMRAVEKAREYAAQMKEKERLERQAAKGKGRKGAPSAQKAKARETAEPSAPCKEGLAPRNAYSAEVIKRLGFDPTIKPGYRREEDPTDIQHQLQDLASRRKAKDMLLGPRPGPRVRSSVSAPKPGTRVSGADASDTAALAPSADELPAVDSDDELEREEMEVFGKLVDRPNSEALIDLDSSSDEG
ncbi:hypothetical protein BV25DRAFT_1828294 [Artomyces pyxidatus]|uniref:Uncharacterized protein n=1 Tax=Artomyces pyxidatus TaxID=48021 RepID=A0ACB8SUV7_9AGAM|nr:hypothetical protein BV25DRAFT_1828294 [Artomyces pyxidatus]